MPRPAEPPPPAAESQPATPDSFESALDRLEAIVARMEGERLPLEDLLACYEQGTRLLQACGDFLQSAEQRIELIARGENGQPRATEFSPASAAIPAENQPADPPPANPSPTGKPSAARRAARPPSSPGSAADSSHSPSPLTRPNHEVSLF